MKLTELKQIIENAISEHGDLEVGTKQYDEGLDDFIFCPLGNSSQHPPVYPALLIEQEIVPVSLGEATIFVIE